MTQLAKILPRVKTGTYLLYIVNNMAADTLASQGAKALASMIFIMLNWNNSVPAMEVK